MPQLQWLAVSHNNLTKKGAMSIANNLKQLTALAIGSFIV
jgi:hypothetical protein